VTARDLDYAPLSPYLLYADVPAALDFLARAFGFEEVLRAEAPDGTIQHAEMRLGERSIMLGYPGSSYVPPGDSEARSMLVHMYVDDVDKAFRRAVEAGARVINEPEDKPEGDRRCDLLDPEGQWWSLSQHVRDVPPEEWGGAIP
jgi:PhnB protein